MEEILPRKQVLNIKPSRGKGNMEMLMKRFTGRYSLVIYRKTFTAYLPRILIKSEEKSRMN